MDFPISLFRDQVSVKDFHALLYYRTWQESNIMISYDTSYVYYPILRPCHPLETSQVCTNCLFYGNSENVERFFLLFFYVKKKKRKILFLQE